MCVCVCKREKPWRVERGKGEKQQVGKRDTLPVTGGKDLGKRKGVAIDYLTGRSPVRILVSDAGFGASGAGAHCRFSN